MNRDQRGRHEAGPAPINRDHAAVQASARASVMTHPGYRPRHRKEDRS